LDRAFCADAPEGIESSQADNIAPSPRPQQCIAKRSADSERDAWVASQTTEVNPSEYARTSRSPRGFL
jgi:hypothetical protein